MRLAHLSALVVVIVIAAGGWYWYSSSGSALDPESAAEALTGPIGKADRLAAIARAEAAAAVMESFAAASGTYAGATVVLLRGIDPTLDPSVTVVSATDQGYCVQAGLGDAVAHATGPGGLAAAGPCPA